MRHFNLSLEHVTCYKVIRSKNSDQILIQLSDENEKKIQLKKLMPENSSNLDITWERALTEFNEYVKQKLTKALRGNKIENLSLLATDSVYGLMNHHHGCQLDAIAN